MSRRRRGCPTSPKVAYRTQMAAYAAAVRVSRHIGPTRTYRCQCHHWHLTTQPKKDTKP